jgi:hypothetical protein
MAADWSKTTLARRLLEDRLEEAHDAMLNALSDYCRPGGDVSQVVAKLTQEFGPSDLSNLQPGRKRRLLIAEAFLSRAAEALDAARKSAAAQIYSEAVPRLQRLPAEVRKAAVPAGATGQPVHAVAIPAFEEAWSKVKSSFRLECRYPVELPHRTWWDRIMFGRYPVFIAMMMCTMVGSAVGFKTSLALQIAPLILAIFAAGLIWSFPHFEAERRYALDEATERLRSNLETELRRAADQLFRAWEAWLKHQMGRAERTTKREIEDLVNHDTPIEQIVTTSTDGTGP